MKTRLKAKRRTKQKVGSIGLDKALKKSGLQSSHTGETSSESSQSEARAKGKELPMSVEEFDRRFDEGEDLESLGVDLTKARRPGLESRRINIDVPAYFIDRLDHAAQLRGITRQSLIKAWLYELLKQESTSPTLP
jgi:hypothetical protein